MSGVVRILEQPGRVRVYCEPSYWDESPADAYEQAEPMIDRLLAGLEPGGIVWIDVDWAPSEELVVVTIEPGLPENDDGREP